MVRYLIIGIQRSGTTVIHKLLMQHPNVSALTDELNIISFFHYGLSVYTYGNENEAEKRACRKSLFDTITTLTKTNSTTHCGAKLICPNRPQYAELIVETLKNHLPDLKVILIERNDLVALYGSLMHAKKSKVYHSWNKGAHRLRVNKLYINPLSFLYFAHNCLIVKKIMGELKKSHNVNKISYEEFCSKTNFVINNVCSFLDLEEMELHTESRKLLPAAKDYIKNYELTKKTESWIKKKHHEKSVPVALLRVFALFDKLKLVINIESICLALNKDLITRFYRKFY